MSKEMHPGLGRNILESVSQLKAVLVFSNLEGVENTVEVEVTTMTDGGKIERFYAQGTKRLLCIVSYSKKGVLYYGRKKA